ALFVFRASVPFEQLNKRTGLRAKRKFGAIRKNYSRFGSVRFRPPAHTKRMRRPVVVCSVDSPAWRNDEARYNVYMRLPKVVDCAACGNVPIAVKPSLPQVRFFDTFQFGDI